MIAHETPFLRKISDEYTIENETDLTAPFFAMQGYGYLADLHVYDSDGTELAVYSNDSVIRHVYDTKSKEWQGIPIKDISESHTGLLVIRFQEDRPLRPKEVRVIRLAYHDQGEGYLEESRWSSLWKTYLKPRLFDVPVFRVAKDFPSEQQYVKFLTILPPAEFEIKAKPPLVMKLSSEKEPEKVKEGEGFFKSKTASILDYAIRKSDKEVKFELEYSVNPDHSEKLLLETVFVAYTLATFFIALAVTGIFNDVAQLATAVTTIQSNSPFFIGGSLGVAVGFLGLVTNPLTNRIKFTVLVPLLISIILVLILGVHQKT